MSPAKSRFGLIVVAAPSGAGKSTLCTRILKELSTRLALSISTTSRAPRGSEKHGIEYFFTTAPEFQEKINQNCFAEWALVHGNFYGTLKATLQDFWAKGKHVLLDIDVQGAESLRKAFPDSVFTIFISPPSMEILEARLRGRGTESEEAIQKRMQNAHHEMKQKDHFDLILVNDALDKAYQDLMLAVTKFMDELEGGVWQKRQ